MSTRGATIFIIDDDPGICGSLRELLSALGYSVETFSGGREFLDGTRNDVHGCVLLDMYLPDLDGLQVQRLMKTIGCRLPVIFVTGCSDIPMTVSALRAGALEFLTKPLRRGRLVGAVENALATDLARRTHHLELADLRQRHQSLTARERDVMERVVTGRLNREIAAEFGTSLATVKEQRAQVMSKMRARSLAELVQFAISLSTGGFQPSHAEMD